jgi:hypothetical protein
VPCCGHAALLRFVASAVLDCALLRCALLRCAVACGGAWLPAQLGMALGWGGRPLAAAPQLSSSWMRTELPTRSLPAAGRGVGAVLVVSCRYALLLHRLIHRGGSGCSPGGLHCKGSLASKPSLRPSGGSCRAGVGDDGARGTWVECPVVWAPAAAPPLTTFNSAAMKQRWAWQARGGVHSSNSSIGLRAARVLVAIAECGPAAPPRQQYSPAAGSERTSDLIWRAAQYVWLGEAG